MAYVVSRSASVVGAAGRRHGAVPHAGQQAETCRVEMSSLGAGQERWRQQLRTPRRRRGAPFILDLLCMVYRRLHSRARIGGVLLEARAPPGGWPHGEEALALHVIRGCAERHGCSAWWLDGQWPRRHMSNWIRFAMERSTEWRGLVDRSWASSGCEPSVSLWHVGCWQRGPRVRPPCVRGPVCPLRRVLCALPVRSKRRGRGPMSPCARSGPRTHHRGCLLPTRFPDEPCSLVNEMCRDGAH